MTGASNSYPMQTYRCMALVDAINSQGPGFSPGPWLLWGLAAPSRRTRGGRRATAQTLLLRRFALWSLRLLVALPGLALLVRLWGMTAVRHGDALAS